MWDFITANVLPLLGTFLVGVVGWFTTHFLAAPLLKFYNLKEQIHEELYFTANAIPEDVGNEKYKHAYKSLRRLAARLSALENSLTRAIRWFLRFRGYNIQQAYRNLTGLSNALGASFESMNAHRTAIERSLKLPERGL